MRLQTYLRGGRGRSYWDLPWRAHAGGVTLIEKGGNIGPLFLFLEWMSDIRFFQELENYKLEQKLINTLPS